MTIRLEAVTVVATGVRLATSGTSASAAIPVDQSGGIPRAVIVSATVAAHVRFGIGSATAVNTDLMIVPGEAYVLFVPAGMTHVAAIQDSAAGIVGVSPVEL